MGIETFRLNVHRHGFGRALTRSVLTRAVKLTEFEICRVEFNSGAPYSWPDVDGYETQIVNDAEFHQHLCKELSHVDYRWAFERGDTCSASLLGDEVVGYTFYSSLPTRVRNGIAFTFPPEQYVYSFASATAPSHRGKRLDRDRWKVARRHRNAATGRDPRTIWYVNIANLESRASAKAVNLTIPDEFIGHIAYINVAGQYRLFASARCERAGTRFIRASS